MIRLRTVGQCLIEGETSRFGPNAELTFAMALYLGAHASRAVDRRALTDLFWPAEHGTQARHRLRQGLYRMRQIGLPIDVAATTINVPAGAVDADFLRLDAPEMAALAERGALFLP